MSTLFNPNRGGWYILRLTAANRLYFYTGAHSMIMSEVWTKERERAQVFFGTQEQVTQRHVGMGHASCDKKEDRVIVLSVDAFDAILKSDLDQRARLRREHRAKRQLHRLASQ